MALMAGAGLMRGGLIAVRLLVVVVALHAYFDQENLPDLTLFNRFEFQAIGRIYDSNEQPLIELAHQRRDITQYADVPAVVGHAILAAEDKRFFSHDGVDRYSLPRIVTKVQLGAWATWLAARSGRDNDAGRAVCPQGGSTITQQLVRGVFRQAQTSRENSYELSSRRLAPRVLSWVAGARNVNMLLRKRNEVRVSLWLEARMAETFGQRLQSCAPIDAATRIGHEADGLPRGLPVRFRDALFVGSTYGADGITVAVRVGFDDHRSLGARETGGRVAMPVFQEVMSRLYGDRLAGPVPQFPRQMEQRINTSLSAPAAPPAPPVQFGTAPLVASRYDSP